MGNIFKKSTSIHSNNKKEVNDPKLKKMIDKQKLDRKLIEYLNYSCSSVIVSGLYDRNDTRSAIEYIMKHANALSLKVTVVSDKNNIIESVNQNIKPGQKITSLYEVGPTIAEHVKKGNVVILDGYNDFNLQVSLQQAIDDMSFERMIGSLDWKNAKALFLVDTEYVRKQATNMTKGPLYERSSNYYFDEESRDLQY